MKKLVVLFAMVAMFAATGCLKRNVLVVKDHPGRPLTMVETLDQYYAFHPAYVLGQSYRFWTCVDQGDTLDCKVECDGETDLDCIGYGWGSW